MMKLTSIDLESVRGGQNAADAAVVAQAQKGLGLPQCMDQAQAKLSAANVNASLKATSGNVRGGLTDSNDALRTYQGAVGTCIQQHPL